MQVIKISDYKDKRIKEAEIINRILDGEKELYELLIRRNNQKLYRVIRSYLKEEVEIEDIMQNSYIKAYTKLSQFKSAATFSTWLIRIGINEALARLKEKGKLFYLNKKSDDFQCATILEMPDCKQLNPQDKMIQQEAKQLLENAIDQLDTKYKVVYMMKEVEEMSLSEIADALDLTIANVKVRLFRARKMLKEQLYKMSIDKNVFEFGYGRCDRITENVMNKI